MPLHNTTRYADYHMHTYYSDDCRYPMEKMVQKAISLGLDEIAFTDHVDHAMSINQIVDYHSYFAEIAMLQRKYAGKITLKAGVEFGVQSHTIATYNDDAKNYPFDFIILSNHQIDGKEFWNQVFQKGKTQAQFQTAYYAAIYNVIQHYKEYSVLGHLDMIKRYDEYGDYPDSRIMGMVDQILELVIKDGKGIELNTSSFKYGMKDLMPSKALLRRYYELGGTILTIGSDAHEPTRIGDHFADARSRLKEIGFRKFCTFEKMTPIFWDL